MLLRVSAGLQRISLRACHQVKFSKHAFSVSLPAFPDISAPEPDKLQEWEDLAASNVPNLKLRAVVDPSRPFGQKVVVLLGCAHDDPEAAEQVSAIITALQPQSVGLELCKRRFGRLFPFGVAAYLHYPEAQQRAIAQQLTYGREQMAAAIAAQQLGVHASPCDRDIQLTEALFLANLPMDLLLAASMSCVRLPSMMGPAACLPLVVVLRRALDGTAAVEDIATECSLITADAVAKLHSEVQLLAGNSQLTRRQRRRKLLTTLEAMVAAGSMWKEGSLAAAVQEGMQQAVQCRIIAARDEDLGENLRELPGPLIVAVVGMSHVEGVARYWREMTKAPLHALGEQCPAASSRRHDSVHLTFWRQLLGRPLLWHLRGKL